MSKTIAAMILAVIAISLFSGCIETGKGYSTDTIYGCELDGLVWKTWSCWLTNDHPSLGKDSTYTAIYSLSKEDTALITQMQALTNEKQKRIVKVYYRNELIVWPWDYSSGTIIYRVEVLP
jgi:hypothetical protein